MLRSASPPDEPDADFSLANHFLIAMPNMADPRFSGTVIYVCEHSPRGALGLVINRPTDLTLATLFERIDMAVTGNRREGSEAGSDRSSESSDEAEATPLRDALARSSVYAGGPVQTDRGFVLHDQNDAGYSSTLSVEGGLALTTSKDVLEALAEGGGPSRLLVTLGYTGWDEGQLETELANNAWLTVPADPNIVFEVPHEARFNAAIGLLGFNPAMLSGDAGHA